MCDCEEPAVYRDTVVTARVAHRCAECRRTIQPGTKYHRVFGVWDHQAETFKLCQRCERVRKALLAEYEPGDCAPCIGELREALRYRNSERRGFRSCLVMKQEARDG